MLNWADICIWIEKADEVKLLVEDLAAAAAARSAADKKVSDSDYAIMEEITNQRCSQYMLFPFHIFYDGQKYAPN